MAVDNNKHEKQRGSKIKGLFGELKKVSWPTFNKVLKQTSTVLVVTIFFLAVLMLMDFGLGQLYKWLVSGLGSESFTLLSGFAPSLGDASLVFPPSLIL